MRTSRFYYVITINIIVVAGTARAPLAWQPVGRVSGYRFTRDNRRRRRAAEKNLRPAQKFSVVFAKLPRGTSDAGFNANTYNE